MDIGSVISEFKNFRDAYERERASLILSAADDAVALMKNRVIQRRVNSEGSIFGIYADDTIKKKGTRNSSSGDKRINFSDTNRMWSGNGVSGRGVKPYVVSATDKSVIVHVEPENDEDRKKVLGYLEDKYGDIVAWSKEEQELLLSIWQRKFNNLMQKYGL